ncbi:MAG TPA: NADH-quinone oxidoreductase subunit C [Actinomycetota bacterium]|nr:NADH-quinone oxidoreductase subunit C [Actinomycetota bacterium]
MNATAVRIAEKFPDAFADVSATGNFLTVAAEKWMTVARWLAGEGGFSLLSNLCGADRGGAERFEVMYNLTNMQAREVLGIRLKIPDGDPPKAPSVTSIWPGANFPEREAYDMFGIVFDGHPDLNRILMPDEWEGHPLRKDYATGKVPIEFKHMSPGF